MSPLLEVVAEPGAPLAGGRPVLYDPVFDEYRLAFCADADGGAALRFCPWCGERLAASKRARWFDELARRGLAPDDPDLPSSFLSDRWWRASPAVGG